MSTPVIKVTRRRTSRLSMRIVRNGDVHVSVPYTATDAEVQDFIERHREWIGTARTKTAERVASRQAFYDQLPLKTRKDWTDAKSRLEAVVRPMTERYAEAMDVHPTVLFYRATVSRWGCCYAHRRAICFSLYLLLVPEWCIEYVVVHELAHLIVPDHSPRFYAVLDQFFPRWKEAKTAMRSALLKCEKRLE